MACLYRHIRKDTNTPFYVGIGVSTQRAYSKTHRNAHWKSIVAKSDYRIDILFDEIEYEEAKEKEREFIALYGRKEDGGYLCNITLGGDGVLGIKHTKEARLKMGAPNKGKTLSDWHKQRISEFWKGKPLSEETKKKMSESALGEKNHRYGTKASEDTKYKMKQSAHRGEDSVSSKLDESKVLEIRRLNNIQISSSKLAKMFNVSKSNILAIINKKTWKHV